MVTEKYLLRSGAEWKGRQEALGILDEILAALRANDVPKIGAATSRNFHGPLQTIIPWASNYYTETLINRARGSVSKKIFGDSGCWAECLEAVWALLLLPQRKPLRKRAVAGDHDANKTGTGKCVAVCDGPGGLRFCN